MRTPRLAGPALIAAALLAAVPLSQVKVQKGAQPHGDGVLAAAAGQDVAPASEMSR